MKFRKFLYSLIGILIVAGATGCSKDNDDEPAQESPQNDATIAALKELRTERLRGGILDAGGFVLYQDAMFKYEIVIETGPNGSAPGNRTQYGIYPYIKEGESWSKLWQTGKTENAYTGYTVHQKKYDGMYMCGISSPEMGPLSDVKTMTSFSETLSYTGLTEDKCFTAGFTTALGNKIYVRFQVKEMEPGSRLTYVTLAYQSYTPQTPSVNPMY